MKIIIGKIIESLKPSGKISDGWRGAYIGLLVVTLVLFTMQGYYFFYSHGMIDFIIAILLITIFIALASLLLTFIFKLLKLVPSIFFGAFIGSFTLLCLSFFGQMKPMMLVALLISILSSLLGSFLYKFVKGHYRNISNVRKLVAYSVIAIIVVSSGFLAYWTVNEGSNEGIQATALVYNNALSINSTLETPSDNGKYIVKTLSYGSGKDLHNDRYGKNSAIITKSVDGSVFVSGWSKLRENYLGFGPKEMPLNGMVWYPEGTGPFPFVLIAHGNHNMTEESEPGYEYLGLLLASRGFIVVSIDENYLNLSLYDDLIKFKGLKEENDARAFIILEHIRQWRSWNNNKDNLFYGKVDMKNIALIGHSRGGEAVAIAADFNKLRSYPDNGNVKFDYNFEINSIIAIAPTDGQYKPARKAAPLKDVNYLVLQGAHDMDVSSFIGSRQYERTSFTEGTDYFKASVYIDRANHGQFNSVWGRNDSIGFGNKLYNLKQLLSQQEQQQIAKVLISSFLEASLKYKKEYRDIFKDIGTAKNWLPETIYISNYLDSKTKTLCSYDEDIDLNTATVSNALIYADNFKLWKENKIKMKGADKDNSAVSLEWDRAKDNKTPVYSLVLPASTIKINKKSSLVFSIADNELRKEKQSQNSQIKLTAIAKDFKGKEVSFPISVQPVIEGKIVKGPFSGLTSTKEPVFQSYELKLKDLDSEYLSEIRFLFDKTDKGQVLIDDIGIRN